METKISIYQVLPRLFGNKNTRCKPNGTLEENSVGKFADFTPKALQEIRDLGITHIWYTGIIQHAKLTSYEKYGIPKDHPALVKGRAGSPYAIKNYYDTDPDLAVDVNKRTEELDDLIERTHKAGLKVIIDFVPNHLFRRYRSDKDNFGENDDTTKSFDPQNNFYYLPGEEFKLPDDIEWLKTLHGEIPEEAYREFPAKVTGNDCFSSHPGKNDWYETVKLNYGVDYQDNKKSYFSPTPDTWHKMLNILMFWAGKKIDGFRCDMAEMVPVEFWEWAIGKVKKNFPDVIFIAEIYNPFEYHNYLHRGGFDFLYDKVGLYDTIKRILTHNTSARALTGCWQVLAGIDANMLRFLENHDEVRIASKYFANNPKAALPAMTVAATLNTGPVMIYAGQEVGEPAEGTSGFSGDDGRTTIYDYYNIPELQRWMNNGKFDGEKLTAAQKSLRRFYQKLLYLSLHNEAVSKGKFYDLMWVNTNEHFLNRERIYTYLRYAGNRRLLFAVNFDRENSYRIRIKIPEHALGEMGLESTANFRFTELFWNRISLTVEAKELVEKGLETEIDAWGALVFEMSEI
jgi:glycosidase